jgi:TctA family transporter
MAEKKEPGGDVSWASAVAIIRGRLILSTIGSLLRWLPGLASASSDVELPSLEDVED